MKGPGGPFTFFCPDNTRMCRKKGKVFQKTDCLNGETQGKRVEKLLLYFMFSEAETYVFHSRNVRFSVRKLTFSTRET